MPWKTTPPMNERGKFTAAMLEGEETFVWCPGPNALAALVQPSAAPARVAVYSVLLPTIRCEFSRAGAA